MRAKLLAWDMQGDRIENISPDELLLTENGVRRQVLRVDCPTVHSPALISAVLAIDVSGSMSGEGLDLARAAAHAWIDAFPPGSSECAITAFNLSSAILQDFTNDKQRLRRVVDNMEAGGGTSFDAAFVYPFSGAIPVVARARHRRIIVLLTDGYASGDEQRILREAQDVGARVYCITLDHRMPGILRNISTQTGGRYFEGVSTAEEASVIYRSILEMSQNISPCIVEWESGGCDYTRLVECSMPAYGTRTSCSYSVSDAFLPLLDVTPSRVLAFGVVDAGTRKSVDVTLTARNSDVRVESIVPESSLFTVTDFGGSPPPFTLYRGQSRSLSLTYEARDSGYVVCRVFVESNACDGGFFATAGAIGRGEDRRTITLLHPNGGEMFVAGSDTLITWSGVAPSDPVRLEYSTDGGFSWMLLAENATGLSWMWRVPNTPSDHCLVRVTAEIPKEIPEDMVLISPGTFTMGDITGSGSQDEKPAHTVSITRAFLMSRTEVTQREWSSIMGHNPSSVPGDEIPVHGLSWIDALAYCNRRSAMEGLDTCYFINNGQVFCDFSRNGYRLPTEAEWEYACRAGSMSDFANGAMTEAYCTPLDLRLALIGWYCGNTLNPWPVAGLASNAWGLYDMHGNVSELCWNEFSVYTSTRQVDPVGRNPRPIAGSAMLRGGAWTDLATVCRASNREQTSTERARYTDGFRVVRTY